MRYLVDIKKLTILALLSLLIVPAHSLRAASLIDQLRGRILLQVQSRGEAWYVNPTDDKRYYLKDGSVAYGMLRSFGLGITNADLVKIPIGLEPRFQEADSDNDGLPDQLEDAIGTKRSNPDTDGDGYKDGEEVRNGYSPLGPAKMVFDSALVVKLKGRILLQVQAHGEAWYLNPADGKRYYMKDGEAAYQIMRFLSLGITNSDLEKIPSGTTIAPQPIIGGQDDIYQKYAAAACYGQNTPSAADYFPTGTLRDEYLQAVADTTIDCEHMNANDIAANATLLATDADKDGLNALLEELYGTSDTKADTDGNGVSDLQEIELANSQFAWDSVTEQIKYETLLLNPQWENIGLANRIDGFTMTDASIAKLAAPVALKQESDQGCFNSATKTGYLRFEGSTTCATGYWLQATGTKANLKIDTVAALISTFGPVSTQNEAASFVAAITPGLKTQSNGAPVGRTITIDDGFLVELTKNETLGLTHPDQRIIYKVSTDGTVQPLAYELQSE